MAISWGTWEYGGSGGNGMRVGVDTSWTAVTAASATAKATFKVYTQNRYAYSDTQTLTFGGSAGSGSATFTNSSGNGGTGAVLRSTRTYTYTYSAGSYGSSPGTRTFSATLSGAYNGVTPSRSITTTIPARPAVTPDAPTGFTATRIDDTATDLAWTVVGSSASSLEIQQTFWNGAAWSSWSAAASLSATATTWRRTGMAANSAWRWRIRAKNATGASAWVEITPGLNTTPREPVLVSSAMTSTGLQITTTWAATVYGSTSAPLARSFIVERSTNGGAWTQVASSVQPPWTDSAPGVGSNRYRVRTRSDWGLPLLSVWVEGNSVTPATPPLAPTTLRPNGVAVDTWADGVTLTWHHNHGGDGVAQTRFEVETSVDGGTVWAPLADVSTSAMSYAVPAGVIANGLDVLWRVRTTGVAAPGAGQWSQAALLRTRTRPALALTSPGGTWPSGQITTTWTYAQAESSPQTQWRATLSDVNGTLLQEATGFGAALAHQFTERVEDGQTYSILVEARSSDGLWSDPVTVVTSVDFPEPAVIDPSPEWQPSAGTITLHLDPMAPGAGEGVAVAATVERRVDDGDWVTLAENLPVPTDLVDPLPSLAGSNAYRITSISALPTYRVNPVVTVTTPGWEIDGASQPLPDWGWIKWVMLSWGPAWSETVRLAGEPDVSWSVARTAEAHAFLGRRRPVGAWGVNRTRALSVSGVLLPGDDELHDSSTRREWEDAATESTLVCLRDMHGNRVFGQIAGDLSVKPRPGGAFDVSFSVAELDYIEAYGAPVDDGGETVIDFHINLDSPDQWTAWGLSVNDNGDGTWTASAPELIDFHNGNWSAEETP